MFFSFSDSSPMGMLTRPLLNQVIFVVDNRTYHFQAEDEGDQRAWLSVLVNCKDTALRKTFDGGKPESSSLWELQQAIIRVVQRLPGNHACADCSSMNGNYC